jgi:mannan endo-1,4-beta-mannosidase
VENQRFRKGDQPYFVYSANYWHGMHLAASQSGNRTRLLQDLDILKAMGVNNLRIMASSEGPDGEPFRVRPALRTSPLHYNEDVMEGLDYVLAESAKRGFSVVLCLNNMWHWSGGFAQYVSWITNTSIPYPSSWDPKKRDYTLDPYDPFVAYASQFYTDPEIKRKASSLFKSHILLLLNRVNRYTGRAYGNDPTIFAWELANEPQFPPKEWVDDIARFLKTHDRNHMVTVGLESRYTLEEFLNAHDHKSVDYCTVHIWAQNRGVYNMTDPSEENISHAIRWAIDWVETTDTWAKMVKKPLILEEFGMPRDNFVPKDEWYSPLHPTTRRDRYFDEVLDQVVESFLQQGSFSGVMFFYSVWLLDI